MNILENNLSHISERWPVIFEQLLSEDISSAEVELVKDNELSIVYENIQVASSFDQKAEAIIQIKKIPSDSEELFLYGTGLGKLQEQLLLNNAIKTLNVVILNITLFKVALTHFTQVSWLKHPKVQLTLATHLQQVQTPFIALPAELVLADNASSRLRDKLCLALDSSFIESKKGKGNQELLIKIQNNLSFIKHDKDVSHFFKACDKRTFITCGAGPTLESHLSWLSNLPNRHDYFIVAVDASVKPLISSGVMPDLIVSIDPVADKLFQPSLIDSCLEIPLVYFPVLNGSFLDSWLGQRYISYSTGELYDVIDKKEPRGRLYSGGSVIHPAIDLCVKMGAKKLLLLGADFSFPEGKTHTHWQEDNSDESVHVAVQNSAHWVLNGLNERVPTLLNYRGYLRDLEDYISLIKGVEFYNGSKKGAAIRGTKIWSSFS